MELDKIDQISNSFKIRASAAIEIMGAMGLTEKQQIEYDTLVKRNLDYANKVDKVKPLTDVMVAKLKELTAKKDNPELPEGAKTHCKKWLKEYLFKRRGQIKAKQVEKGNLQEEDGFTLMAVQLNLGMVYKNTQLHQNEYLIGTDDIFCNAVVYDNKCSYSLDTFPMFEVEIPDDKYDWQINVYCELRKCLDGALVYTLIDAPEKMIERELRWLESDNEKYVAACQMIFTKDAFDKAQAMYFPDADYTYFVEIPAEDRIVKFDIKKDPAKIEGLYKRVPMCREYIKSLLIKKYHGKQHLN